MGSMMLGHPRKWIALRASRVPSLETNLCDHTESVFYQPGDFAIHFIASSKHELTAYLKRQA